MCIARDFGHLNLIASEQFPFQLLPTLDYFVFEYESFHHIDCKKGNYLLQKTSEDQTNIMCSKLEENSTFKTIIDRSLLPFEDLRDYNNRYLNYKQLSSKSTFYHQELRRSRLDVMDLRGKVNRLGDP